jgi:outer membrane beta-barrel protein
MENRTQRILLKLPLALALLGSLNGFAMADQNKPLIAPDVKPVAVDESLIDEENFELTLFAGMLSIEDFESSALYGARLTYHLSEAVFLEGSYGVAEAGKTSYEKLAPVLLLSDSDRDYSYYSANLGWNVFPGEVFFGRNFLTDTSYAMNTNFYLTGGVGSTDFAGDSRFTINFGAGFQVLMTDWLALHFDVREHFYDIDVLGEKKTSFNNEASLGLSFFF